LLALSTGIYKILGGDMEYTLVRENDERKLIVKVNELIAQGWKPQEGFGVFFGYFYQAMIRENQ
jgi:hypothetical protein